MATDNPIDPIPEDTFGDADAIGRSPHPESAPAHPIAESKPATPPLPADPDEDWMLMPTEPIAAIRAAREELRLEAEASRDPESFEIPEPARIDGPVTESLDEIRAAMASARDDAARLEVPPEPIPEFFVPAAGSEAEVAFPDEPESALNILLDPAELAPVTEVIAVQPQSDLLYEPEPPLPIDPESLELLAASLAPQPPAADAFEKLPAEPVAGSAVDNEDITNQPLEPDTAGSGWLEAAMEPEPVETDLAPSADEESDIFSNVQLTPHGLISPPPESSSIFGDPPAIGSSLFDSASEDTSLSAFRPPAAPAPTDSVGIRSVNPGTPNEGTVAELNLEQPSLLDGLDSGLPPSPPPTQKIEVDQSDDATMVDEPIPYPAGFPGGIDFNQIDTSSSGSNLFADAKPDDQYGASSLNLSRPDPDFDPMMAGGQSSIFVNDEDDVTEADFPGMDDQPSELDMDFMAAPHLNMFASGINPRPVEDEDSDPELGFDGFDPNLDADSAPSSIFNADIPGGLEALGHYGDDDALDPPSELDMMALPAPPSSIFRPAKNKPPEQAWGDDGDDGSIFGQDLDELTEAEFLGMDDDPSELDMDILPAPASSIFRPSGAVSPPANDPQNQGMVSFDIPADPNRGQGHQTETSGLIDWSVPPDQDDLNKINLASTGATGPLHQARAEAGLDQLPGLLPPQPIPRPTTPAVDELESWASPEPLPGDAPSDFGEGPGLVDTGTLESTPPRTGTPPKKKRPKAATSEKRSRAGLFAGVATGLFVGIGACAGAYFGGLLPGSSATPNPGIGSLSVAPANVASVATVSLADAYKLLAAGDPVGALQGFEQAPEDAPADVRVGRGQARWLTRIRELAANNQPANATDEELQKAMADLEAGRDDPRTAVQATLHLGLLKEITGDTTAAQEIYTQAALQFPEAKPVFEAALHRLQAFAPAQPGTQQSRLTPRQADELARALVLTSVLLQNDAKPAAVIPEPGILFWQAANDAAAGNYDAAIRSITAARKLHDQKRLQHAGVGINPLSDPLHQIFLRTCDDLRNYWALRRDVYGHPKVGDLARKDGVTKTLDTLVETATTAGKLETEKKLLVADLDLAGKKLKDAETLLVKVGGEKDVAQKDLADAKKMLTDRAAELTAAEGKLKTADATFAAIIGELKTNKLIDSDDPAKLPGVLKTVAAAAASSDAKKAAATLLEARKTLEIAQADVKKAEVEVKAAQAKAQAAVDNVDKLVAAAKAEKDKTITALNEKAAKDAAGYQARLKAADEARLAEIQARENAVAAAEAKAARELATREAEFRKKLAEQAEEFTQKVADIRSGARVPLSSNERAAQERAARAFSSGVLAYQGSRYPAAAELFVAATQEDANDARYWYFLGLSYWAQGQEAEANAAFKKGAELETRNRPSSAVVSASLERVQGVARRVLAAHRP